MAKDCEEIAMFEGIDLSVMMRQEVSLQEEDDSVHLQVRN